MCQLYTGLEEGVCRTSCLRPMRKRDLTIGYTIVSISDLSSGVASMVAVTKHHRYVSNFHNLLLRRGRGADYCDQFVCVSVCVCVCPRAYLWNRWTDLLEILSADPCGRDSVLLWRRCDTLCTSGFMDDVTFGRNGPYCDACDTRAESGVYECLVTSDLI